MYEDNLYLSNLYEYLGQPVPARRGKSLEGPDPSRGLEFENVSFAYPGADENALTDISLTLRRGESLALVGENGSGKTTLIKLLTRLYEPTDGRILLDGLDLRDWDVEVLRRRIGVIFQDFGRYQFTVGENIGAGDVHNMDDEDRQEAAAETGMAAPFIDAMPERYNTQLGRWFKGGRELSGGQWQKVALSRAFMRSEADVLVLDEPTAAMDAAAEATGVRAVPRRKQEQDDDPDFAPVLDGSRRRPDRRPARRANHRGWQSREPACRERHVRAPVPTAGQGLSVRTCQSISRLFSIQTI